MDGTPYWRRFFRITLPWISPVVFFAIVYASIGALQVYRVDRHPDAGRPGRRDALDVDPDRRGGLRQLRDRLRRLDRGGHDRRHPRHHRRPQLLASRALGAALSARCRPQRRAALGRLGDHRRDGGARRLHAAAVRLAVLMSFRPVADAYKMPPSFLPPSLDFTNYRAVLELAACRSCRSTATASRSPSSSRSASSSPARSPPSPSRG